MKKIYLLLMCVFAVATAFAQPKLIGHRGSYWGLENSTEAFINGAKKGYHYLETDVKVTKDGVLVCCHNDDLTSWGGTLTIANSNWEDLKAEELSQTRGGVKYTGHLTSFEEYLDICKEYNVLPLIELKWATGINNSDFSNVPKLIQMIEEKGFRNSCFLFTSMKTCLNHIRQNYPDIQLMLLVYSESFESSLSWCSEQGIHIGSGVGAEITKEGVRRYHDAGLKVNAWSCNTNNAYKTYGNYGCDFITTDYLDPEDLPELNPDVLFPPNLTDYPEQAGAIRGNYEPQYVANVALPEQFKNMTVRRALVRNGKWYVLAHDANQSPILSIVNPETGEEIKRMDLTGVDNLSDIAFSADGILLGCNHVFMNYDDSAAAWKVYKWDNDNATPQLLVSQSKNDLPFNVENQMTIGSSFAVSGKMNDLYLYTMVAVEGVDKYMFLGTKVANGTITATTYAADDANYSVAKWGEGVSIMVTPFSRNNLLIDSKSITPVQYSFSWDKKGEPMAIHSQWKEGVLDKEAEGHSFLRLANKVYSYSADYGASLEFKMYNVSSGIDALKAVSFAVPDSSSATEGVSSYVFTGIEYVGSDILLYYFTESEGLGKYIVKGKSLTPSSNADFALELVWENSRNKGNAPEHIDGTNAQQGAAYKGTFYVNDCVDKKCYLFNNTGCIGSIPGGSGWGTAVDDAGNVIIRDDKNTDGTHQFIIYPSGASVDNPGEAVTLEVKIPIVEQTNFISASGDVLGNGGYIYMYPNKQEQINIISIVKGEVDEVIASDFVSLEGTAAGFVIPIDNNSEEWIYNVRSGGFYRYVGGANEAVLIGRGTTTAPTRNTSGGGEYFVLSGHEIFLHPSGANYKGGFTIRNLTNDEVITSVDPIGDLGYVTGGNYSTFNWLFAEKIDESSYYIYLYCPANGMAMYRFYDKYGAGVENITAENKTSLRIYPNPVEEEATIETQQDIESIAIYNMAGAMVQFDYAVDGNKARVNLSSLPAGIYFVNINNGNGVAKIVKK
ncbi:MAG: T9SS type A sorting domain-containing protein [Muribaculaceae bacterium]|nr:T9SS type A sorting domain-containing protein [Muribaculaceae bacterium]